MKKTLTFSLKDAHRAWMYLTDTRTDKEYGMEQTHSDTWEFDMPTDPEMENLEMELEDNGFEFEIV